MASPEMPVILILCMFTKLSREGFAKVLSISSLLRATNRVLNIEKIIVMLTHKLIETFLMKLVPNPGKDFVVIG